MRVLVTGASGFLGAHVVRSLLRAGDEVRALVRGGRPRNHIRKLGVEFCEGDLLDDGVAERACEGVDAVLHCASLISYWARQRKQLRAVNVDGTMRLLHAANAAGVGRFVHVSSAATVGASRSGEVLEERTAWDPEQVLSEYAATKREGEERVLAAAWGGLPALVLNPSLILGPRLDGLPPSPLVVGIQRGRLPWVPPGGVSVTDVTDVADTAVRALRRGRVGERYLLAGHNATWAQLYGAIAENADGRVPRRKLGPKQLAWLRLQARVKDTLRISRPPFTEELYRSYGTYAWFTSQKAERELGYEVRPLVRIVRHAIRREAP